LIRRKIRETSETIRRRFAGLIERLRKRRVVMLDPTTGQVASYDPETSIVDMGDSQAHMSDVEAHLDRVKEGSKKGKLDTRFNPLSNDSCILLPCRKCSSMTCRDPVAHFGITYDDFLGLK